MVGSLVREISTEHIGIIVDTYIYMAYKDEKDRQDVECDYFVKWNNGEICWVPSDEVEILSEST